MTDSRRLTTLVGAVIWLLAIGYVLPFAFKGWIPHDDGLLGQLGERTLRGEVPHVDFQDPYTGGLSLIYAAAFDLLGTRLASIRWVLLVAFAVTLPFFFALARRFAPLWLASVVTLVAAAWTVPVYFAGLPSWYGLFLAIIALWAFVRHLETEQRRWLVLAGLGAGISCTIKITGLYLIAGLGLALLDAARRSDVRRAGTREPVLHGPAQPFWTFAKLTMVACFATFALVASLVGPAMGSGTSGSWLALLLFFVIPVSVLLEYLTSEEQRARTALSVSTRVIALGRLVAPLVAGIAIPVALFLGYVVVRAGWGALGDVAYGVFVLPRQRFGHATFPLPPAWSLLVAAPVVVLAGWSVPARRRTQAWITMAVAIGVAITLAAIDADAAYRWMWLPVRAFVPLTIGFGIVWLKRIERQGQAPLDSRASLLFAVLSVTAFASLIQFPDAFGIYFLYVAPLASLALLAVAMVNPRAWRVPLLVVLVAFGVFAVGWLHRGHPLSVGIAWRPVTWDFPLDMPRGGVTVDRPTGAMAMAVTLALRDRVAPGDAVFAGPDTPEIAFLSNTRDPLRNFYAFFDPTMKDPVALEALLERENVKAAVVLLARGFSDPLDEDVIRMLRRRYPSQERIGSFMVMW